MSTSSSLPQHPLLPLVERHNASLIHLKQIHAKILRTSTAAAPPSPGLLLLYSRLIHHSSSLHLPYASLLLLHSHPSPNSFCFNSLIRAHSRRRSSPLHLYILMFSLPNPVPPDKHTFPFLLRSLSYHFDLPAGLQLHSHILKLGLSADTYISNSLIHFYSSCSLLPLSRLIFDRIPSRNRVSWNSVIDAYSLASHHHTALHLFTLMMRRHQKPPDVYTMQSVLRACAGLGALSLGMWAHRFMMTAAPATLDDVLVNNSLIDLYSKCGALPMAQQVFIGMHARDVTSWNAMMLGLSVHGHFRESLDCFEEMRSAAAAGSGVRPDSVTFVAVLTACKHGGLVEEGRRYLYDVMVGEYGIEPRLEHFGCMVDMLARAGLIAEALEVVNGMPRTCSPDVVIWRSILDACCRLLHDKKEENIVGIAEFSRSVAIQALQTEEEEDRLRVSSSGTYVLLSRLYASANRWNDVGLIRRIMTEKGIWKEPGCSSIELMDGSVHEFVAGDTSHPQTEEIYEKLRQVEGKLASVGYKPDSTQASMVAGRHQVKLDALRLHSERIAIAFGLLHLRDGMPIRILKNLRVCVDCHAVTKLISRLYNVEIVVRDRTRFHRFRDGSCSCADYW